MTVRIFAEVGTVNQQIGGECPPGWVEMQVPRPSNEHIATDVGSWALVTPETLKALVTQKRWQVETGGISLPTGVRVATGIDDQNRITSVVANAERAGVAEVDFKAGNGWARVTVAELQAIAAAVALHVQACFSAERAHHEVIDALVAQYEGDAEGLQAALGSYDIESGWPSVNPQQA